jgi:hypothetical protein
MQKLRMWAVVTGFDELRYDIDKHTDSMSRDDGQLEFGLRDDTETRLRKVVANVFETAGKFPHVSKIKNAIMMAVAPGHAWKGRTYTYNNKTVTLKAKKCDDDLNYVLAEYICTRPKERQYIMPSDRYGARYWKSVYNACQAENVRVADAFYGTPTSEKKLLSDIVMEVPIPITAANDKISVRFVGVTGSLVSSLVLVELIRQIMGTQAPEMA